MTTIDREYVYRVARKDYMSLSNDGIIIKKGLFTATNNQISVDDPQKCNNMKEPVQRLRDMD